MRRAAVGCLGEQPNRISFKIERAGVAADPLKLAHWLRVLAGREFGHCYDPSASAHGTAAVAGSIACLTFRLADRQLEWATAEPAPGLADRGVRVFVDAGAACQRHRSGFEACRAWVTESFEACLVPVAWRDDAPRAGSSAAPMASTVPARYSCGAHVPSAAEPGRAQEPADDEPPLPLALLEAVPELFYSLVVEFLTTREAARLACACARLADALLGEGSGDELRRAGKTLGAERPRGAPRRMCHGKSGLAELHVHGVLSLRAAATYASAFAASGAEIVPTAGLGFADAGEVEAAGATWLEISHELRQERRGLEGAGRPDDAARPHYFVLDFTWRADTTALFFSDDPTKECYRSTSSALVALDVVGGGGQGDDEDPADSSWCTDTFKFRMLVSKEERAPDAAGAEAYRLAYHLVGSKGSSRAYSISLHTVDLAMPVHVEVPEFDALVRAPIVTSSEVLGPQHPVLAALRRKQRVRALVRMRAVGPKA